MFGADEEFDRTSNQSIDNVDVCKTISQTKVKSKFFCEGIKEKESRL
jgi:hypothetical protein